MYASRSPYLPEQVAEPSPKKKRRKKENAQKFSLQLNLSMPSFSSFRSIQLSPAMKPGCLFSNHLDVAVSESEHSRKKPSGDPERLQLSSGCTSTLEFHFGF